MESKKQLFHEEGPSEPTDVIRKCRHQGASITFGSSCHLPGALVRAGRFFVFEVVNAGLLFAAAVERKSRQVWQAYLAFNARTFGLTFDLCDDLVAAHIK